MNAKGVRLMVVGNTSQLAQNIQDLIRDAETSTAHNTTITLTIAVNYGGRWDVLQAIKAWQLAHPGESVDAMIEESLSPYLAMNYAPAPDLLIRSGGESRISNFMLWQTAYTELFFSDILWPDFSNDMLDEAIAWYANRDRRFGGNSKQPNLSTN
jgi:undecaprenyl diphosphate synthase